MAFRISSIFSDMPKFLKPANTECTKQLIQQGDNDYSKTDHYIDLIPVVKYDYPQPPTYHFPRLLHRSSIEGHWKISQARSKLISKVRDTKMRTIFSKVFHRLLKNVNCKYIVHSFAKNV